MARKDIQSVRAQLDRAQVRAVQLSDHLGTLRYPRKSPKFRSLAREHKRITRLTEQVETFAKRSEAAKKGHLKRRRAPESSGPWEPYGELRKGFRLYHYNWSKPRGNLRKGDVDALWKRAEGAKRKGEVFQVNSAIDYAILDPDRPDDTDTHTYGLGHDGQDPASFERSKAKMDLALANFRRTGTFHGQNTQLKVSGYAVVTIGLSVSVVTKLPSPLGGARGGRHASKKGRSKASSTKKAQEGRSPQARPRKAQKVRAQARSQAAPKARRPDGQRRMGY